MASRRAIGHWLILLLLSVLFSSLLLRIHLPAALLLGPLIAGLILSLRGVKLSIPRPCYLVAQAIVGCMIARAINPSVFGVLFNNWALVLAILLTTPGDKRPYRLAAGPLQRAAGRHWRLGKLSRRRVGNGGDGPRSTGPMCGWWRSCSICGCCLSSARRRWWCAMPSGNEAQEMTQDIVWFPSLTLNFPFTLLLTAVACWLGMRLRIPSGAMLLPMLLGAPGPRAAAG